MGVSTVYSINYTIQAGRVCLDGRELSLEEIVRDLTSSVMLLNQYASLLAEIPECPEHGACIPHAIEWVRSHLPTNELLAESCLDETNKHEPDVQ